ncbi:MAG: hypothetical protein JST86_01785 [Bacteroidetes bacterium]|nr:hypothetical protein [Bacteroidota bacterium]
MKLSMLIITLTSLSMFVAAQKQKFDIAAYAMSNGWTAQKTEGHVSYSRIDSVHWAQITIYKSTTSTGTIDADFDKDWMELVAANKNISSPEKTKPQSTNGWAVISGSGTWQYNGAKVTSVLTIYSNNQVYISVLCNTTAASYLKDYQTLLASITLNAEHVQPDPGTNNSAPGGSSSATANNTSIVGIWIVNEAETRGFTNGHLMYSGGYMRKEYQLKEDGTYIFRSKNWLANNEAIYFVYESGTWSVNGNQLTITSKKGRAGWWYKDKITNDVNKWGSFQKAVACKLQTVTYSFEIKVDPNYGNAIILNTGKPTERDGGQFNNAPYRFPYVNKKESLIDNPPGFTY